MGERVGERLALGAEAFIEYLISPSATATTSAMAVLEMNVERAPCDAGFLHDASASIVIDLTVCRAISLLAALN